MKNTLKTVITLLLISLSFTTYAQEKQNDATWEECIEFINDNKNTFQKQLILLDEDCVFEYEFEYTISQKDITIMGTHSSKFTGWKRKSYEVEINLQQIRDISEGFSLGPRSGDYIRVSDGNNNLDIYIKEDEMRIRIIKAFKQLAYLASEKRKDSKF